MRIIRRLLFVLVSVATPFSAIAEIAVSVDSSDTVIYFGGDILTMEGDTPKSVEAVVQVGERIAFVGKKAVAIAKFFPARQVDLKGKTMVPGMIDTHMHWAQFVLLSALDRVNPIEIKDVDAYLEHLKQVAAGTPEGEWIINYGYEKLLIPPYRNLTRVDLDSVSSKHPILSLYNNFHWATASSSALALLEIDRTTPTKMAGGGIIFKDEDGEPTGLLTESAVVFIAPVLSAQLPADQQSTIPFELASKMSAYGLTTIADLGSGVQGGLEEILALQKLAHDEKFALRVSATPMYEVLPQIAGPIAWDGKFQATRCKLLMDASLAGGTSATIKPQLNDSRGSLNYTPREYQEAIKTCMNKGFGVSTHVMGDRAHKVMLEAFEKLTANGDYSELPKTIEHSAIIDPLDLPRIKRLNISVGFLSPFTDVYGDPLRDIVLGDEMASRLFAAVEYDKLGINTTHHSDGPIVAANPLYLVWAAVNRTTAKGVVLGPKLRQTPYRALLGVTRNAARHLGLGDEIGSLSVGKLADFAILAENPTRVDPMKIRDIAVLQTIKGGKVYFTKQYQLASG